MQMQDLPRHLRMEVTMYYSDVWVRSEGEKADLSRQDRWLKKEHRFRIAVARSRTHSAGGIIRMWAR
jgi:hypothetical protein